MHTKWEYIVKPLWKWVIAIPVVIVGGYSDFRAEVFPSLPPLWKILPSWEWGTWLFILIVILLMIVIEGLWKYNKQTRSKKDVLQPKVDDRSQKVEQIGEGNTALQAGRDININNPSPQENVKNTEPEAGLQVDAKLIRSSFARISVQNIGSTTISGCYGRIHKIVHLQPVYKLEEDITDFINENGSFISWSGGSHEGEKEIVKDDTKYLNIAELVGPTVIFRLQNNNPKFYVNNEFIIDIHIGGKRNGEEVKTIKETYYLEFQGAYIKKGANPSSSDSGRISPDLDAGGQPDYQPDKIKLVWEKVA